MRRRLPAALLGIAVLTGFLALPAQAAPTAKPDLAPTPPMGWNSWNKFGCNINEQLIRDTADAMVSSGMTAAGYKYVNIDDCWMAPQRDAEGRLAPDPVRFPNGIKALADYVHAKGLKLGIYSSAGSHTCAGKPASQNHETVDAQTWASWGVDLLKYDNCNVLDGSPRRRGTRRWATRSPPAAATSSTASASGVRTSRGCGPPTSAVTCGGPPATSPTTGRACCPPRPAGRPGDVLRPEQVERPGHARGRQQRTDRR